MKFTSVMSVKLNNQCVHMYRVLYIHVHVSHCSCKSLLMYVKSVHNEIVEAIDVFTSHVPY